MFVLFEYITRLFWDDGVVPMPKHPVDDKLITSVPSIYQSKVPLIGTEDHDEFEFIPNEYGYAEPDPS